MTVRTALLESRFILGDRALYDELIARFDKVASTTAPQFVEAKLAERETRVRQAGSSRYLVEPNVKDGKGGLRDLNTLFWISKYVYRVRDTRELVPAGLFTQAEYELFTHCEEFLWRVRCHMHFITGRAEERLSFDLQRAVAEKLGYAAHGGLLRRRALHEALLPHRQGCRRPHRRSCAPRLKPATPSTGQCSTAWSGASAAAAPSSSNSADFAVESDRITVKSDRGLPARPGQSHSPVLAGRSLQPRHPSRCQPACHPLAQADQSQAARRPPRPIGCFWISSPRKTPRKWCYGG